MKMKPKFKRIFVIVADSLGVGYEKDADHYFNDGHNDIGSNTLLHILESTNEGKGLNIPNLTKLGLGDLLNGSNLIQRVSHPSSFVTKLHEWSTGKDTMTGHWEMMGVHTKQPFQTFTDHGFPKELIDELEKQTGHKVIGNIAASGTQIIKDLGEEQVRDNSLIVYTSADSVLQIAAHEEVTGLEELYRCCEIARQICMKPEWMVGRIIARPYIGDSSETFKRVVAHRHDLALRPAIPTVMNVLKDHGLAVECVGKISDIFDGYGVTNTQKTSSNEDGMDKTISLAKEKDFTGLCFVNLVEFDSEYGHRRNINGYGQCIEQFDKRIGEMIPLLNDDDLLIITADHGNDPSWYGTDHTREAVPFIAYSSSFKEGEYIQERDSFADIGATILTNFELAKPNNLLGFPIREILKK